MKVSTFEAEKFRSFHGFCMSVKLFYMKVQDGTVQIYVDLRESMWDSMKDFLQRSTCNFSTSKLSW